MSRKPLLIIFITVFVDLLGFGIVLPLLPRYAEHFLPVASQVEQEDAAGHAIEPARDQAETPNPLGESVGPIGKRDRRSGFILGCLMASFSAMQFLFAPLWGMLSDRIGRRPVLLVGLAGSTIFYALFGLVTQWGNAGPILGLGPLTWLFITRIGAGVAGATIPTAQAYIADSTDEKSRGRGMAIIGAAFGFGFTFGPLLGAMFVPSSVSAAPSPAPGYVAAALSGLAFLFGLTSLPESLTKEATTRSRAHGWLKFDAMFRVLTHKMLGPIILAMFMTTFAFGQFETTLATLTKRIGVDDRGNFYVFAYIGLVLTLAQGFLVRRLIPRLGEVRMAMLGVVLMTVGLILLGQMASWSQSIRQVVANVPQQSIQESLKSLPQQDVPAPGTWKEFDESVLKPNQIVLPELPSGYVYDFDLGTQSVRVLDGPSQTIRPFTFLLLIMPIVVVGFACTTPSLQSLLSLSSGDDEQGEVLGVGQSIAALARIAGPVVGLTLQERNLAQPYWFGALLMGLGVVMISRLSRTKKSG